MKSKTEEDLRKMIRRARRKMETVDYSPIAESRTWQDPVAVYYYNLGLKIAAECALGWEDDNATR